MGCDRQRSPGVRPSPVAPVHSYPALKLLSTQTFPTRTSFGPYFRFGLYFRRGEKHRGSTGCTSRACGLVSNTQDQPHHQVRKMKEGGEALTCSQLLPFLQRQWQGQSARSPSSRLRPVQGSLGKWIWFNCPLARPGDPTPYVVLSISTYSKYCCSV